MHYVWLHLKGVWSFIWCKMLWPGCWISGSFAVMSLQCWLIIVQDVGDLFRTFKALYDPGPTYLKNCLLAYEHIQVIFQGPDLDMWHQNSFPRETYCPLLLPSFDSAWELYYLVCHSLSDPSFLASVFLVVLHFCVPVLTLVLIICFWLF